MRYAPAIALGRIVRFAARLRKPGGGSAIPGYVVNRVAPGFLAYSMKQFSDGAIVISGSAGKSTTTKMLVTILRSHGLSVFTNPSTANIAQGLTSALLERADLCGRIPGDVAVLELDEAHGARLAPLIDARTVVLTNVMVDQIDRFFDSETVSNLLGTIAQRASGALIVNADDALVVRAAARGRVDIARFGVSDDVWQQLSRGLGYTKVTSQRLRAGTPGTVVVTHVGDRSAEINLAGEVVTLSLPAKGVHYALDAAAAIAAARQVLAERWHTDIAIAALGAMEPVFARGEQTIIRGQKVEFYLIQNPTSLQLNVDAIAGADCVMFALGTDVRDPSYLWSADLSRLGKVEIATGYHPEDAALLMAYSGVSVGEVITDLPEAIEAFFALPTPPSGVKTVVFSADSMRRTRRYLGLTKGAK